MQSFQCLQRFIIFCNFSTFRNHQRDWRKQLILYLFWKVLIVKYINKWLKSWENLISTCLYMIFAYHNQKLKVCSSFKQHLQHVAYPKDTNMISLILKPSCIYITQIIWYFIDVWNHSFGDSRSTNFSSIRVNVFVDYFTKDSFSN